MPHIGLWSSKHAPLTHRARTTNGIPSSPSIVPAHEFARFQHAVRRLKWKLPYLADSHRKATSMLDEHRISDEEKKEIETMFKLDFYEYYTVLEKAIVCLLGVWGVEVEVARNELTHTYHAAILTTLQDPTNPLFEALGRAPVFGHLLAAKQLRNRWKNAEAAGESDSPPPLKAFEIEEMLLAIFGAFEQAEITAKKHLDSQANGTKNDALGEEEIEAEAVEYVDEMDWETDVL